jgi:hypothetical protein
MQWSMLSEAATEKDGEPKTKADFALAATGMELAEYFIYKAAPSSIEHS